MPITDFPTTLSPAFESLVAELRSGRLRTVLYPSDVCASRGSPGPFCASPLPSFLTASVPEGQPQPGRHREPSEGDFPHSSSFACPLPGSATTFCMTPE